MANFLEHESCPKCGSRDNRGVYDDGSKWCFGCHTLIPGVTTVKKVQAMVEGWKEIAEVPRSSVKLPDDAQPFIPSGPYQYLASYSVHFFKDRFMWSEDKQLLIYRVFDEGKIVFWNGRYLGQDMSRPKYISEGRKDKLHILEASNYYKLGNVPDTLVIVEDIVSGIRVQTANIDCGVLFGSHVDYDKLWKLPYKNVVLWLDHDKAAEAIKVSNILKLKFNSSCIHTFYDPKTYNLYEVAEKINKAVGKS